ncbi:helix-turn-helix domain-containing protein [Nonomuraea ceibae]|uniref:helix-turn-helix domain-containing protein n=1 Tax=Nonomuraea ceibae TaxID=1935170 RepID=UPI001C5E1CDC|nr:helix-turn-helix transcriptional regulator [Nonomuraea ceibae]
MPDDPPELHTVQNVAEFMASMRRLKACSGLTYRQLEEQAEAAGEVLPRSTLASALERGRVPRPALVAAFVRACGVDHDTVAAWVALSLRLADATDPADVSGMAEATDVAEDAEPEAGPKERASTPGSAKVSWTRPGRRRWPWRTALGLAVCMASLLATAGSATSTEQPAERATAASPVSGQQPPGVMPVPPGRHRIRLLPSQLCLAEKPGSDLGLVYQAPCSSSFPVTLIPRRSGIYEFATVHPVFGDGCMGIDRGQGLVNTFCDDEGFTRNLLLEPVSLEAGTFRLRAPGRSGCVGVHQADKARVWARLALRLCSPSTDGQLIRLERLPAG